MIDREAIEARLNAATPGPWVWRGNMDHEDPRLVGHNRINEDGTRRFPGMVEVLWSYGRERKADDPGADQYREYLRDTDVDGGVDPQTGKRIWRSYTDEEIEEHVRDDWLNDQWDGPISDRRMCFTSPQITALDARELAVFEVGRARGLPDDTPRSDKRIYRADIVDVRHPDAQLIAHAPSDLRALLDENAALTTRAEAAENRVLELGAEVARLRAALTEIAAPQPFHVNVSAYAVVADIASAALEAQS